MTAPKFEVLAEILDHNPRTSTPKRDAPIDKYENISDKNSYLSWLKHLNEPKNTFKVRGTTIKCNDFIAGHLVLNVNKNDIQQLNNNFINLILDVPNPQELITTKENKICKYSDKSSTICYQFCHCNKISNKNVDLPIGYKVDQEGFITQTRPRI